MTKEVRKRLSANDIGETGTHQAGILVPKDGQVLAFFPTLDRSVKNPRVALVMHELYTRSRWEFNFIYYNGKFFDGTRNEFRLTCMTGYLRSVNAKVGDELLFTRDENYSYEVSIIRERPEISSDVGNGVLVLSGGWKVIKI